MRKNVVGFLVVAGWLIGSQSVSAQESGKEIFIESCAACHSIGGGRLVGPDLKGVNDKRPEDWLIKFTKSSQTLVKSGDKTAVALFEEFNKIPMPDQALSDEQIKEGAGSHQGDRRRHGGGQGKPQPSRAAAAPVAEAQPGEIQLGQDPFEGKVRFTNGGPSCNACHHVTSDTLLGGGLLPAELSLSVSAHGPCGGPRCYRKFSFPGDAGRLRRKAILTGKEINALVGFLQHVDKEHARQMPKEWGWRMFSAGAGGVVVLLGIFSLAGRRRKETVRESRHLRPAGQIGVIVRVTTTITEKQNSNEKRQGQSHGLDQPDIISPETRKWEEFLSGPFFQQHRRPKHARGQLHGRLLLADTRQGRHCGLGDSGRWIIRCWRIPFPHTSRADVNAGFLTPGICTVRFGSSTR